MKTKSDRRRRVLARTEQAVGAIGIVVSLVLIVGVVFAWAWTTNMISNTADGIDGVVAKGQGVVTDAEAAVAAVSDRVDAVATEADRISGNPKDGPSLGPVLLGEINALEQRYLKLRNSYAELRDSVVTAAQRLDAIGNVVPALAVSAGTLDQLRAADDRMQALDAQVMSILDAKPSDVLSGAAASGIATAARAVADRLDRVSAGLGQLTARLDTLRTDIASRADMATLGTNLLAIVMVLLLLYLAAIHLLVLRSSRARTARTPLDVAQEANPSTAA